MARANFSRQYKQTQQVFAWRDPILYYFSQEQMFFHKSYLNDYESFFYVSQAFA